jgi:hypothetical protein
VAAPIYLKFGLRNSPGLYPSGQHLEGTVLALSRERVRRAALGLGILARYAPEAVRFAPGRERAMTPRISRAAKGARRSQPMPPVPRASSVKAHKIVDLRTTVVGTPWRELVFLELMTDGGLTGVGEVRIVNKTDTLVACLHELGPRYVVGATPSTWSGSPGTCSGRSTAGRAR